MISASATTSASSAFHHTAACSHAAAPVPATTGATALGNVLGRAPEIHWEKLATEPSCQEAGPAPPTRSNEGDAQQWADARSHRRQRLFHLLLGPLREAKPPRQT